ncbi:hypothetical protein V2J09_001098 [Rumex salicifolius]
MEIRIAGCSVDALIDTRATHNFMRPDLAKKLGLKLAKEIGSIMTVNSEAQPIAQVVKEVPVEIDKWTGKLDFSVALMDDFALVLGMDGMRRNNFVPLPYLSSLVVMEKDSPCLVPMKAMEIETPTLSAMQLIKGVKKGEPTFLVVMSSSESGNQEAIPPEIESVLKENEDVMPPELPKILPPRREVDHKIELESGALPPAKAPYRMTPLDNSLLSNSKEVESKASKATTDATHSTFRGGVAKPSHWGASRLMEATSRVGESHLTKAQKRMKKWVDTRRRPLEFRVGDLALMKLFPQQLKSQCQVSKGLLRRYEGSYEILAKVGKVAYKLALPDSLKVYLVVHVSILKPYHPDPNEPRRGESS